MATHIVSGMFVLQKSLRLCHFQSD